MSEDDLTGTIESERYKYLDVVGRGSTSVVYRAEHTQMKNYPVAIKVLNQESASMATGLQRFTREAQVASSLCHPAIVTIKEFGVNSSGRPFLVMELLEGKTLKQLIADEGQISVPVAYSIFCLLSQALAHMQGESIIHGSINPTEIIVTANGADGPHSAGVKLIDFGSARNIRKESLDPSIAKGSLEIRSDAPYMSPEQCRGLAPDYRSDIYSLGCVMYTALLGQPPFIGKTFLETVSMQTSKERAPSFKKARPDLEIDSTLEQVVMKALEKDPNERFQSAEEMLEVLNRAIESKEQKTKSAKKSWLPWRK